MYNDSETSKHLIQICYLLMHPMQFKNCTSNAVPFIKRNY